MRKRQALAAVVSTLLAQQLGTRVFSALPLLSDYEYHYGNSQVGSRAPDELPSTGEWSEAGKGHENSDKEQKGKHDKHSRQAEDEQLNDALRSTVCANKFEVKWDDVAGLDTAKKQLQMAAEMPIHFPKLFAGKRQPCRFILLYGPPGTGKGHLVKALASGVDSTLFVVSSSDVQSKYHGESERLVRLAFENARRKKPSIIFFDEVEALCSSRTEGTSEHNNRVKTEFLVQMDGTAHDNTGVLFVAATNLPWSLDPAFRRRLQKKIHIALPDKEARRDMFMIKVGNTTCDISSADYYDFAEKSDGFSGSDITNVVQEALMEPIVRIQEATHWRKISRGSEQKLTPCLPGDQGAMPGSWRTIPESLLLEPIVSAQDFYNVLARAKSSVGQDELQRYHDWTKRYGMEGA